MNNSKFLPAFFLCLFLAGIGPAQAASRTWVPTTGTNDWFNPANWDGGASIPGAGDAVTIATAGAALLTSSPGVYFSSLTLSKTLIFSNWNTTLSATNITIQSGGTVTVPAAFTGTQMSNNVYFVCSNLTVETGGKIDVSAKGFLGLNNANGFGPGAGRGGDGQTLIGAGYGGYAGHGGWTNSTAGMPYGSSNAPIDPGSSGGGGNSGWSGTGGNGGGAIRITAGGAVVVYGSILADGGSSSGNAGGGAGGSVYITCGTFSGSNGVISANGGNDGVGAGGGGGGRIAVIYNTNLQAAVPAPSVRLQVAGATNSVAPGDIGTLYFPDKQLLSEMLTWSGAILVPGLTNWTVSTLTVSNGWVRFNQDGFNLTVSNNLLLNGSSARLHISTPNFIITNNAPWFYGGTTASVVRVGGSLILTNGGGLYLYAAVTNPGGNAFGARLMVTGDVVICSNACLYPGSHPINGGTAYLRMRNLTIHAGGKIQSDGLGWIGQVGANGLGPGAGNTGTGGGHGGYGGQGGYSGSTFGLPCGSVNAPIWPGSAGGGVSGVIGGSGGGAIIIAAESNVMVNGEISANGAGTVGYGSGGSGAGGSIYITCLTISGSNGLVKANGGVLVTDYVAGGGGGRISVNYDTNLQAAIPRPEICFQAKGGIYPSAGIVRIPGDIGTIYFPDTRLLAETLNWSGQIFCAGFTNWAVNALTVSNGWIRFPQDGFNLTVSNNLVLDSSAAWLQIGATVLHIMNNTPLFSGGATPSVLNVGGNLVLTNGSSLYMYGAVTNSGPPAFGARVSVAGDMYVGSNSWVYPQSHPTNGGSVSFQMRDLKIEGTNGGFDANAPRGFSGGISGHTAGFGPGSGTSGGGSYGGLGGGASGPTYGSSNAPVYAGSGGGSSGGSAGGGLVYLLASRTVTINGILRANGTGNAWGPGASSGGGIFIRCKTFIGSTTGSLQAWGGGATWYSGAGGGGRIAVWRINDTSSGPVTCSVSGGTADAYSAAGAAGTLVWGWMPPPGTIFSGR